MKGAAARWAAAGAGLALAWAVGEAGIRLLMPGVFQAVRVYRYVESERGKFCRYDAELGWAGTPDVEDDFEWVDCRARVRQNEHGFRGASVPFERTKAPRWVFLGDSYVWGFGVGEEAVFTERLRGRGGLETVNLGVSGYGNDQDLLLWRRLGRRWKPDRVFLVVTLITDLYDNAGDFRYGFPKPVFRREGKNWRLENVPVPARDRPWDGGKAEVNLRGRSRWALLVENSAWAALAVRAAARAPALRGALERRGVIPRSQAGYDWELPLYKPPYRGDPARGLEVLSYVVGELVREARVTVVLAPSPAQVYPRRWEELLSRLPPAERAGLDPEAPMRVLSEAARSAGAEVVDLLPAFRRAAASDPDLYFPANLHWTDAGHRVAAEALWDSRGAEKPL